MTEKKTEELNIDERRNSILELLKQNGKIRVADLSRLFAISEVTIRNDLSELEAAGLLDRVHGGAVSNYRAYYNMSLLERAETNEAEKKVIAAEIATLINDGDTLMINSGTTTLYIIRELRNHKNLTVVTNSVSLANESGSHKNMEIILLGGMYNPQYQFTYGDDVLSQLKKYKADKLILSVDGISAEEGITTYHHHEAEVNRQMMQRVNKTYVAADFSKVGRVSFSYISPIDSVDMIITNYKAGQRDIDAIIELGTEVRLV